jgi:hypothetical protein
MMGQPLPKVSRLRLEFPRLTDKNHLISSPSTDNYNCIAWAYEVSNKWMWPGNPDCYWSSDIAGVDELQALIQLYIDVGYEICDSGQREDGFKKVAIYVNQEGPQHAARQLESGHWTSKLGICEDIEHDTLEALEGESYGKAKVFLRKRNV